MMFYIKVFNSQIKLRDFEYDKHIDTGYWTQNPKAMAYAFWFKIN